METNETDSRIKSLESGRNLYLAMVPYYINRTRRNGAGFKPLRIIYIGLTLSMGLYMLQIWVLPGNCFQDIAGTLFIFFGF